MNSPNNKDVFERDDALLLCTECGGRISYDQDYNLMICSKCGHQFKIHDIKTLMEVDDDTRAEMFKKKEKVKVEFEAGYDWKADRDNDPISMISINS